MFHTLDADVDSARTLRYPVRKDCPFSYRMITMRALACASALAVLLFSSTSFAQSDVARALDGIRSDMNARDIIESTKPKQPSAQWLLQMQGVTIAQLQQMLWAAQVANQQKDQTIQMLAAKNKALSAKAKMGKPAPSREEVLAMKPEEFQLKVREASARAALSMDAEDMATLANLSFAIYPQEMRPKVIVIIEKP